MPAGTRGQRSGRWPAVGAGSRASARHPRSDERPTALPARRCADSGLALARDAGRGATPAGRSPEAASRATSAACHSRAAVGAAHALSAPAVAPIGDPRRRSHTCSRFHDVPTGLTRRIGAQSTLATHCTLSRRGIVLQQAQQQPRNLAASHRARAARVSRSRHKRSVPRCRQPERAPQRCPPWNPACFAAAASERAPASPVLRVPARAPADHTYCTYKLYVIPS